MAWAPLLAGLLVLAVCLLLFRSAARGGRSGTQPLRSPAEQAEEMQNNPRTFTPAELRAYDGKDKSRPLLLAIKGRVLNVSSGEDFYGVDGPYNIMAGKDASKAFAMMSLKEEYAHADLTGVSDDNLKILDDWYNKLVEKYPTCGRVLADSSQAGGDRDINGDMSSRCS